MCSKNSNSSGSPPIPTLETQRLRLREWRISDFEAFATLKTNADLQQYVLGRAKPKGEVWDDFCALSGQWMLRGVGAFLVADKQTDAPVGFSGLWFPPDIEVPELCWSLFPGNMGRGYANEATFAARQWVYDNTSYRQLVSFIHPDNTASCAVAERLGAKLDRRISLYGLPRLQYRHPDPDAI